MVKLEVVRPESKQYSEATFFQLGDLIEDTEGRIGLRALDHVVCLTNSRGEFYGRILHVNGDTRLWRLTPKGTKLTISQ